MLFLLHARPVVDATITVGSRKKVYHLPPLQAAAYGGAATAQYGATTVLNPAAAKQHAAALADDAPPARPEQTQQVGVFACVQGISIRSRVVCFLSSACSGAERRSTALAQ